MSKWRLAASCASWFTGYEEVVYCIMVVDGIWDLQQLARVQVVNDRIHIISSWRVARSGLTQLMMLLCSGWWHMAFESTHRWQQQWLSGRCGHSILSWDRTNVKMIDELHHHHSRFTALFRDHPGDPLPDENFWTLWCKGRLTEADTLTIQLGATPSGPISAHLHHHY